jgi:hypothetical protein
MVRCPITVVTVEGTGMTYSLEVEEDKRLDHGCDRGQEQRTA